MDDIARRAGVGVGTLYRHFPTKDALTSELVDQARRLRGPGAGEFEDDDRPWESCRSPARADRADGGRRLQQRMIFAMTKEAMQQVGPTADELREATQKLIDRAQAAVSCARTSWSTTFAP